MSNCPNTSLYPVKKEVVLERAKRVLKGVSDLRTQKFEEEVKLRLDFQNRPIRFLFFKIKPALVTDREADQGRLPLARPLRRLAERGGSPSDGPGVFPHRRRGGLPLRRRR